MIEMLCKLKTQLTMVCTRDPAVPYHFYAFSDTLNLPEVKPYPQLLLSRLSPTFSYTARIKLFFSSLLSSFFTLVSLDFFRVQAVQVLLVP